MSLFEDEHCGNRHFPFDKLVAVLNYCADYWLLDWIAAQCMCQVSIKHTEQNITQHHKRPC